MESESAAKTSARIHWVRAFFVSLSCCCWRWAPASATKPGSCPSPAANRSRRRSRRSRASPWPASTRTSTTATLSIALEFSRPLVGSQNFDDLLAVTDDKGAAVKGSWVLDENGLILRFPVRGSGQGLRSAGARRPAGRRRQPPGQGAEGEGPYRRNSTRRSVSPRRAACCRRAKAAACRWCRSTSRKWTSSSCASREKNLPQVLLRVPARRAPRQLGPGQRVRATTRRSATWPSRSTSTASCWAASPTSAC